MNIERIRSFYNQRPVRPFTIHTASGEKFTVRNPETMAIGEEAEMIVLVSESSRFVMLDLSNITGITQD